MCWVETKRGREGETTPLTSLNTKSANIASANKESETSAITQRVLSHSANSKSESIKKKRVPTSGVYRYIIDFYIVHQLQMFAPVIVISVKLARLIGKNKNSHSTIISQQRHNM